MTLVRHRNGRQRQFGRELDAIEPPDSATSSGPDPAALRLLLRGSGHYRAGRDPALHSPQARASWGGQTVSTEDNNAVVSLVLDRRFNDVDLMGDPRAGTEAAITIGAVTFDGLLVGS